MTETASTHGTPRVISLWPGGAPGSESWTWRDEEDLIPPELKVIRNVAQPTLTVYLPDTAAANGTAVVVCPGGAFHFLSIDMEGTDVARWLNAHGVAAFVLRYRLIHTGADFAAVVSQNLGDRSKMAALMATVGPMAIADGQQAVRLVRSCAPEFGIAPDRIGIMGFSAGGMVTANVALLHDADSRPNFAAPIYSASFSDMPAPADAPPLFILCAHDDEMAVASSMRLYTAWKAAGLSAELHIYSKGGHGFGMRKLGQHTDTWIERFGDWLAAQGYLS